MDIFEKQSSEEFTISIDFTNNLADSEDIASIDVKAYFNTTDVTSTVIKSTTFDDDIVFIKVENGINKRNYKITAIITTTDSNVFEHDVIMKVVEA